MEEKDNKGLKQKVVNIFLNITILFLGIILLISVYNFIQTSVLGNQYSSFFGYTLLEVKTGSMEPSISPKDWIVVKQQQNYEYDQIISFIVEDEIITHRIKSIIGTEIETKGDANPSSDKESITTDQVIGEVVNIWPSFGIIKNTVLNLPVIILLVITLYILSVILKGEEKQMFNKVKQIFAKFSKKDKVDNALDNFGNDFIEEDKLEEKINVEKESTTNYQEQEEDYTKTLFQLDEIQDELEDDSQEENTEAQEEKTQEQIDEELSKTTFFRIISVEENENDINTVDFEEEEEFEDLEELPQTKEEPVEEEIEEVEEKEKTLEESIEEKIALESIFNKVDNRKAKGVIAKLMAIKEEEIIQMITAILKDTKVKSNEPSIKRELIKSYIESKYYSIFSKSVAELDRRTSTAKFKFILDNNADIINEKNGFTKKTKEISKKILVRIGNALEEDSVILSKKYTGADRQYNEKIEKHAMLMMLIARLEFLETSSKDMKGKKNLYAREIIKFASNYDIEVDSIDELCKQIISIQKDHTRLIKYFTNRLKTEVFELIYSELKSKKNKYIVNIKHNINFSQVYSEEIIDKAYQEGIVAEDKLNVLMALLQARLGKDMLQGDSMNEYLIAIPDSLCDKEKKLQSFFHSNDNEYAKKNIIYLVPYDEFMQHAKIIKDLRKIGYRISCYINQASKLTSKSKTSIALAEYIFIDKKIKNIDFENVVLDNFKDRIIKEDLDKKLKIAGDGK